MKKMFIVFVSMFFLNYLQAAQSDDDDWIVIENAKCNFNYEGKIKKIINKRNNQICDDKIQISYEDLELFFCSSDIDTECAQNKSKNIPNICKDNFKSKKLNYHRLWNEMESDKTSEDVVFNLMLKGLFTLQKGEQNIKTLIHAKYIFMCEDGGGKGEGIFTEDEDWLFIRNAIPIW